MAPRTRKLAIALLCVALLGSPASAQELAAEPEQLGELQPIGDLDGDGRSDFLSIFSNNDDPATPLENESSTTATALRGIDGSSLWTAELPNYAVQARRLRDGGILFAGYNFLAAAGLGSGYEFPYVCCGSGVGRVSTYLLALNSDGTKRWERSFEAGAFLYAETAAYADQLYLYQGHVDGPGLSGGSIVSLYDRTPSAEGQEDSVTTMVIDDATGETLSTNQLRVDGRRTVVRPTDDVTGDGTQDYLIKTAPVKGPSISSGGNSPLPALEIPPDNGASSVLHAIDAVSGQEIWALTLTTEEKGILQLGDVAGDEAPDLAVGAEELPEGPGSEGTIAIIDGSSGNRIVEISGQLAVAAPDADGDGKDEVLTVALAGAGSARWISYELFKATGESLGLHSYEVTLPAGSQLQRTYRLNAGDVNDDGVLDLSHTLSVIGSGGEVSRDERMIDGHDGSTLRIGTTGAPLFASVDGDGDDLYTTAVIGHSTVRDLTVIDGRGGEELWARRIEPQGRDFASLTVESADVDGDGLADLLVTVTSTTVEGNAVVASTQPHTFQEHLVLSGLDGHVLWSSG